MRINASTPEENQAARSILSSAKAIEDCCYYGDAQGSDGQIISAETVKELTRAFRVLRTVSFYYFAGDLPLSWKPPDGKFVAKRKEAAHQ